MSPKIAPYIRLPPSFLHVLVDAAFPVGAERLGRSNAAHGGADDLIVQRRARLVALVVHRAVRTDAETCRLLGRVDVCAEEQKLPAVLLLLPLNHAAHSLVIVSKGYKQRVGIAQALLGDPKVVILDEPTVDLDPLQIIEIRDLIRQLGEKHTVILSSHILSEVQAICDKVLIISNGKLVAYDDTEKLVANGKTTLESVFLELTEGQLLDSGEVRA